MSPFPRFGAPGGPPFGGLGSLRDSALNAGAPPPNPLSYPPRGGSHPLVSSASPSDLFGLPRPGFPSLFSSPPTSLGATTWAGKTEPKTSLHPIPGSPLAPPSSIPKAKQQAPPLESPGRNGSAGVTNGGHHGSSHRPRDHSRSPMRPPSSASSSLGSPSLISHHLNTSNPSLDLSVKKDDTEITVVGEKVVNNHRP